VLHHGAAGWTASTSFEETLDVNEDTFTAIAEHVPRFRFLLDDVSRTEDEELRARAMSALGRLVILCFKLAKTPDELIERLGRWTDLIREVYRAPNGVEALVLLLRYILAVSGERPMQALRALFTRTVLDAEEVDVTIEEHIRQWNLRDIRDGELRGSRRSLVRLLDARFGALPESVTARIEAAELDQLDRWTLRVLTAGTLDEVFADA
jgi:hypothetical protein